MVDETTGDILVFTSAFKSAEVLHRSRDHGRTWATEDITIETDKNGWRPSFNAACVPGATLKYGPKKGRLLMPTRVFVHNYNYNYNPKGGPKVFDRQLRQCCLQRRSRKDMDAERAVSSQWYRRVGRS